MSGIDDISPERPAGPPPDTPPDGPAASPYGTPPEPPVRLQVGYVAGPDPGDGRMYDTGPPDGEWPVAADFRLTFRESETFGYQVSFAGLPGGTRTGWPWWDFADADIRELDPAAGGPVRDDDEQGFSLRMRERDGQVYVAVGTGFTAFHTWFRVPRDRYDQAWADAVAFAREHGSAFRSMTEALRHRERARFLDLWNTDLYELPAEVGELTGLVGLRVGFNSGLTELPESVTGLARLRWIDARFSGLRRLPRRLDRLTALRSLNVAENPLPGGELDRARRLLGASVVYPGE